MPILSKAETINPKREPPPANAVTVISKASPITTNVMPLILSKEKDLLLTDIKPRLLMFSPKLMKKKQRKPSPKTPALLFSDAFLTFS